VNDAGTERIIGAALHVHRELGCGFLEAVYAWAMGIELRHRGIDFEREVPLHVQYRGEVMPNAYRIDLVVGGVLVELKALRDTGPVEEAQLINYLQAAGGGVGLLLNFGSPGLGIRRFKV